MIMSHVQRLQLRQLLRRPKALSISSVRAETGQFIATISAHLATQSSVYFLSLWPYGSFAPNFPVSDPTMARVTKFSDLLEKQLCGSSGGQRPMTSFQISALGYT